MSSAQTPTPSVPATPVVAVPVYETVEEIDASCRGPLLLLFASAGIWVAIAGLFGLIASIQLVAPQFLADCSFLTFGRLRPAAENALLYGFASQAAYGIIIWMLCRLGRTSLCCQFPFIVAGAFWNVGVTVGVISILAGFSTGFKWLEFPRFAAPILFLSQIILGLSCLFTFHGRRERNLYVSSWYLVGAIFWFTWIYSAAVLLLDCFPTRGVLQAIVNAWYANNFLLLWLGSVGLASVYYFIPKLTGRPLYSRSLAAFSFWTYAFFANWTGLNQLVGGPIPAWLVSTSVAANILLILPLIGIALNWRHTLAGDTELVKRTPVLKFAVAGGGFFLLASLLGIVLSTRSVAAITQLTYAWGAYRMFFIVGFFALAGFAVIYYVMPRLVNQPWPSEALVRMHFTGTAAGALIAGLGLLIAGIAEGVAINNPHALFHDVISSAKPWLILAALGSALIAAGQIAFLLNLHKLLHGYLDHYRVSTIAFVTGADTGKVEVPR
jgi:cytochrome c oxidase cbb3-type subunit 1